MGNSLNAQNVIIPDTNFKAALIQQGIDTNGDGNISYAEAAAVNTLNLMGYSLNYPIIDLTGYSAHSRPPIPQ